MLCENISASFGGHLLFAGQDTVALAGEYQTPLYLMDEDRIRHNCRIYLSAFKNNFSAGSMPVYAGKACSFTAICRIMQEEGMALDVVSAGELSTAIRAGFDLSRAFFHGNNKTDFEIDYAVKNRIGYFVVDCIEEIGLIEQAAARYGVIQKVLLRLTPGIDPHTYEAVSTGKVDSKFGSAIETGQAEDIAVYTLLKNHIDLAGFHCHVGSQVFEEDVFERSAEIMLDFIAYMRDKHGYTARMLDLGGGYGVRYLESDGELDIETEIAKVSRAISEKCALLGLDTPKILMEPGRSIVADAGMTLYTVGSVKQIPGYKNYVSVDGGMGDNPRYALYGSEYTCFIANRMNETMDFPCSLVGRFCESGDIVQPNILLPHSVCRGDIAAVCTTGAYNYSMASNYNRVPRPAVVMLRDGSHYLAVKRESLSELCLNDL